ILLIRIIAVYPPRTLSWVACACIYGILTVIMVARIVNVFIAFREILEATVASNNAYVAAEAAWNSPYVRVEWALQLCYDIYASILFLVRLGEGFQVCSHALAQTIPLSLPLGSHISSRLRTLFWIATTNFVFPVILNVVQLVVVFRDRNFTHGTYILSINIYVEIIGVLFATLWCSESYWTRIRPSTSGHTDVRRPLSVDKSIMEMHSLPSLTFASASETSSQIVP
ncbi:hypothetical protein C8Q80DRAFT_1098839, partial [Daedaleopsis nitida]